MKSVVAGTSAGGYVTTPSTTQSNAQAAAVTLQLGSRVMVEAELDDMLTQIGAFWNMEPDEVMRISSALSARCTTLAILLHRVESRDREFTRIRTMQVHPILEELDRQFKAHSRMVELRRQDLALLNGS